MPSLAGQELDKYAVLEEVGHGGMAVVYRGRDTVLDREVAVKVLHPHLADREESRQRLQREALTVAKLRHENIVEIYDYSGPDADESYIVTEFIHGQTLRDWLDEQWQPHPVVAAMVMHQLCLALEHAHAIGVVHRDIKPENVMIRRDGCLKLMDFGIAQILDQQKLTMTGQLLGSPAYMAPELICGKPVDKRTDLFACGVLLYQLATGHLPFSGRNPHEVLHKISDAQYQPARLINPKVDDALSELIDHALAQEPVDRFQSARSMANELEDYLARFDISADDVDLCAYFKDPLAFLDELDSRLAATLVQKARAESKTGNRAKALGLLAQVIELDPDHSEAQGLIDEVKARGRHLRLIVFAASAFAVGGLVIAGVMLSRAAGPTVSTLDAGADAKVLPRRGGTVIPADTRPNRPRTQTPSPEAARGVTSDPTPVARDTRPNKRGPGARLRTQGPASIDCTIEVRGLSAIELSNKYYTLTAAGQSRDIDAKTGLVTIAVPAKDPVTAELRGGAQGEAKYGRVRLDRDKCAAGKVPLAARPHTAKVRWAVHPASRVKPSLETVALTCVKNCWRGPKTMTASKSFVFEPPDDTSVSWEVVFEVQAPGVKPGLRMREWVNSGRKTNQIKLSFDEPV